MCRSTVRNMHSLHRSSGTVSVERPLRGMIRLRAQKTAPRNVPTVSARDANGLIEWASSCGAKVSKVTVASFKGMRGLRAEETIQKGEVFLFIPRNRVLVSTPGMKCPFPSWIDPAYFESASWSVRLALLLLQEERLGQESKVVGYIQHLPQEIDLPYFWSPDERAMLTCTFLQDKLTTQLHEWPLWYQELMEANPGAGISQPQFEHALACVYSRSFFGPYVMSSLQDRLNIMLLITGATAVCLTGGWFPEVQVINASISAVVFNFLYEYLMSRNRTQHALCPVIDSANHSSRVDAEVNYEVFLDGYSASAAETFSAGEQAFISYGKQTSDSLIQWYGFTESDNPNDLYTFSNFWGLLAEHCDTMVVHSRLEDVTSADAPICVSLNSKAQLQDNVKASLRYVLGLASTLIDAESKVSNQVDAIVWEAVLRVAEIERRQLGGRHEDDVSAAKRARALQQGRRALALEYNVLKKQFLSGRIAQLKTRVAKMRRD